MFCISDAFIDGDRIRGSIHNVVDKAFESGIKMSSCRYKNHSITLDVSFEPEGGFDKLLLEILYGDRIRKTTDRLNDEWLKKMWNVSEDDLMVFRFEQIAKKFYSAHERLDSARERLEVIRRTRYTAFNYEKTSQSEQGSSVQARPGALDQEGSFLEGEGCIRD